MSQLGQWQQDVAAAIAALSLTGFVFDAADSLPTHGTRVAVLVERGPDIATKVEAALARATEVLCLVMSPTLAPSDAGQDLPYYEATMAILIAQNTALDTDDADADTLPGWRVLSLVEGVLAGLYEVVGAAPDRFSQWRITGVQPVPDEDVYSYQVTLRRAFAFFT